MFSPRSLGLDLTVEIAVPKINYSLPLENAHSFNGQNNTMAEKQVVKLLRSALRRSPRFYHGGGGLLRFRIVRRAIPESSVSSRILFRGRFLDRLGPYGSMRTFWDKVRVERFSWGRRKRSHGCTIRSAVDMNKSDGLNLFTIEGVLGRLRDIFEWCILRYHWHRNFCGITQ